MALDGFSLRQVGLGQDNTSAQMAINTEHDIRQSLGAKNVDQISNTDSEKAVTLDEEKENDREKGQKRKKSEKDSEQKEDPYTLELNSQKSEIIDIDDFYTKFSDKLGIRLNKFSDVIELYNKETNKTLEAITAADLIKLVDRLKVSSGILVNKKI